MSRRMLNDRQWLRIADLLPGKPTDKGGRVADNRRFVEAVLFIARKGCPWRDLPADFGNWHSIYVRFARWEKGGVWARVAEALSDDADLEELFIDAAIVRAHQHAAGALKKRCDQAIGRSRGGLTTKIHACVDALGKASVAASSLYARYRAPTGLTVLERPLRYVLEVAHTT